MGAAESTAESRDFSFGVLANENMELSLEFSDNSISTSKCAYARAWRLSVRMCE